jgi:drug/metabolite transporter (DMT)-like permease
LCWTFCALAFESACKKAGSSAVNFIRLVMAFVLLGLFCLIYRGAFLPLDATPRAWFWLFLSGVIGFALGDFFLFRAFEILGARVSMLIMASVPPMTALIGWVVLSETLTSSAIVGMALTVSGIIVAVSVRKTQWSGTKKRYPVSGVLFAFCGAVGQAVGLVLSKLGMGDYDPFAAAQIRIIAAIIGFSLVLSILKEWPKVGAFFSNGRAVLPTSIGAILGPFLGVALSLLAIQHTTTSVASTIMAIVPVLIIPPAVVLFKERVTVREVAGAFVAVIGVVILFL